MRPGMVSKAEKGGEKTSFTSPRHVKCNVYVPKCLSVQHRYRTYDPVDHVESVTAALSCSVIR